MKFPTLLSKKTGKKAFLFLFVVGLLGGGYLTWEIVNNGNLGAENSEAGSVCTKRCVGTCFLMQGTNATCTSSGYMDCPGSKASGCCKFETICPKSQYTITYSASTGGKIQGKAVQKVEIGKYSESVTAVADTGYFFSSWGDGNLKPARKDLMDAENKAVQAVFKKKVDSKVTYKVSGDGKIEGQMNQTIKYGEWGTSVKATPNKGSEFRGWSRSTESPVRKDKGTGYDTIITAVFQKIGTEKDRYEYLVLNNELGTLVSPTKDPYNSSIGNTAGVSPIQYLDKGQVGEPVQAKAYSHSEFVGWSDGRKDAIRTDMGNGTPLTVYAVFQKKGEKKAKIKYQFGCPKCGAYIHQYWDEDGFFEGQNVQYLNKGQLGTPIVARDYLGYKFVKWSDGYIDLTTGKPSAKRQDTGDGKEKIIYAIYEAKNQACTSSITKLEYKVKDIYGGYIKGDRVQTLTNGCECGSSVTAVPYPGWKFVGWEYVLSKKTESDRQDSFPFGSEGPRIPYRHDCAGTRDIKLLARFEKITEPKNCTTDGTCKPD